MASRNKLEGISPDELAEIANKGGQKAAADHFGVSDSTVSRALNRGGYKAVIIWIIDPSKKQISVLESAS